jgi:ketosteroid isomerase-like protein
MSRENIDVSHALYARWNSGERPDPAEYSDPAVELDSPFSSVVGEPYRGHAGVEQWMRDVDEQFSEWRVQVDDIQAVGDAVIAIGSVHGRGRASSINFDRPMAWSPCLARTTRSGTFGSTSTSRRHCETSGWGPRPGCADRPSDRGTRGRARSPG